MTIVPIVGMQFRPPAKAIIANLPAGWPLVLVAEPLNEYDDLAIKVLVDLRGYPSELIERLAAACEASGWSAEDLIASDDPVFLGYIAKPTERNNMHGHNLVWEAASEELATGITVKLAFDSKGWPHAEIDGWLPLANSEWSQTRAVNENR